MECEKCKSTRVECIGVIKDELSKNDGKTAYSCIQCGHTTAVMEGKQ